MAAEERLYHHDYTRLDSFFQNQYDPIDYSGESEPQFWRKVSHPDLRL